MASSGPSLGALEDLRQTLEESVVLTLFLHEVKLGFKSLVYRGWLVLSMFFLFFFLLVDFTSGGPEGMSIILLLYYFAFAGSLLYIVLSSASVTGELERIADSLLSKAVRRWEYILSKYLSQLFLALFVFALVMGLASLILWAFERVPDDPNWWNACVLVGMIVLVVTFFTCLGVMFSSMASRTVFAFLMGMLVWFVMIFLFAINPGWETIYSPIVILNNAEGILQGNWDIDWWKLVSFYVLSPIGCFLVSLLAFYNRDL